MLSSTASPAPVQLRLEALEAREVPAITIQLDYTFDLRANGGSGFFETNPEARATMSRVAQEMGGRVSASLAAINPTAANTWTAAFYNPATGTATTLGNVRVAANTIVIYVGGRAMPGGEAAQGGYGGYGWSGSSAWGSRLATRGSTGFAPWGGSVAFDTTERWHYGTGTAGLDANELDFYSVATHELGHVMGIGTSNQWFSLIQSGRFVGPRAQSLNGGPVPLDASRAHWADGVTVDGREASLDPTMSRGRRVTWSSLDQAALRDIGWGAGSPVSAPTVPPAVPPAVPPTVPPTLPPVGGASRLPVLVSGPNGRVDVYARGADGNLAFTGKSFTPFAGFGGAVRTAVADFNGDGVADYAFATGA
ncbi:MAG TPA: matrixin family metalloprotease, partial [Gemmata sp.]|nr:matrixin family metalloprotease [Gemmata sp.]